jgi:hypothetical protein
MGRGLSGDGLRVGGREGASGAVRRMGTTGRGVCAKDVLALLDKVQAGEGGIVGAVRGGGGCREVLMLAGMVCALVFMAAVVQAVACEVGCAVRCLRLRAQLFFLVAD